MTACLIDRCPLVIIIITDHTSLEHDHRRGSQSALRIQHVRTCMSTSTQHFPTPCSLSAPVRDVTQPDTAPWNDKYIGVSGSVMVETTQLNPHQVVDFLGVVEWMMDRSWGQSPDSFLALSQLKSAFKTTPISELTRACIGITQQKSEFTLLQRARRGQSSSRLTRRRTRCSTWL